MKLSLIAAVGLLLCSCASGTTDEVSADPPEGVIPAHPKPVTPPADAGTSDTDAGPPDCVVNAYWADDCYVVDVICKDKPERIEVSCGPGRPLWPWEIIPDPPYERNDRR
jgi:hypothetical protein